MDEPANGNGRSVDADASVFDAQLRALESDVLLARSTFMRQVGLAFNGQRDYYAIFGYDRILTARQLRETYARDGIAKRIVEAFPKATWRGGVEVYEDEDPKKETAFEKAFKELAKRLNLWSVLERADILAGLSTYSVILLGAQGNLDAPLPKGKPNQLLYLTPFWGGGGPKSSLSLGTSVAEVDATIESYDDDPRSPRFGEPQFYSLKRTNMQLPTASTKVHWSRVVHVAEGCLDDNVFGVPTLENVYNLLHDLTKVTGGGAEAFWLRANQGFHANLDKDLQLADPNNTLDKLRDDMEKYQHGLTRWLRTRGVDVSVLGSDVANFSGPADAILKQIAGSKGIPLRILTGSERGELASSQDAENWNAQIQDRRTSYVEPYIVRRLIDRLIAHGYLPEPAQPYQVGWPVEEEMSEPEKADLAVKLAQANAAMGEPLFTEAEIREKCFDMKPLTDKQRKEIDERNAEKLKQQQAAMGEPKPEADENATALKAAEAADAEIAEVLAQAIRLGATDVIDEIIGTRSTRA